MALGLGSCAPPTLQEVAVAGAAERADGGVLIVITDPKGGRTVATAGLDASGLPLDPDATWRIGSITKTFTAIVVLQLVDEGRIDLDDDIGQYLDNPLVPTGATVRHLLQHTSGVPDYTPRYNEVARSCPENAIDPFALVAGERPAFAPGAEWQYSNSNYLVLGQLIEALTGLPPASAIRERVIGPLGLGATYLEGSEDGPPPVPAVADFYDSGPGPITCGTPVWANATDGGMISNAQDLDTFFRAVFGGQLVSASSLAAMLETNEFGYGLGMSRLLEPPVEGVEIYGNGGGVVGYKSIVLYESTTGTTIVVMSPTGHEIGGLQTRVIEWAFGS